MGSKAIKEGRYLVGFRVHENVCAGRRLQLQQAGSKMFFVMMLYLFLECVSKHWWPGTF